LGVNFTAGTRTQPVRLGCRIATSRAFPYFYQDDVREMRKIKSGSTSAFGRLLSAIAVVLLLLSFTGCSTDPAAKRQKFILQGDQEFAKAKYPEAVIYYSRAIQIDKTSAEAHFKLAKCFIKQKTWGNAYRELQKTVELQPENEEAQLELGKLLLAGGKARDARDRAEKSRCPTPAGGG